MAFAAWDIVVVPFPYTDQVTQKRRPALVVSSPDLEARHGLVWLVMITSANNAPWAGDVAVSDLAEAGLPAISVVRPAKIATVDAALVLRRAGTLPLVDRVAVDRSLSLYRATQ